MISRDSEHCVIVKYDLATQELIGYSEDMNLGHANDGAYNPNNNTLAIVHCLDLKASTSNIVYIVDAQTLSLRKTIEMKNNIHVTDVETGEHITTIPLNMGRESENMFIYDGKFYVSCNNRDWTGCEVYSFEIVPECK